jgi:hypothetical protein
LAFGCGRLLKGRIAGGRLLKRERIAEGKRIFEGKRIAEGELLKGNC